MNETMGIVEDGRWNFFRYMRQRRCIHNQSDFESWI